jgi:hypothetical protein
MKTLLAKIQVQDPYGNKKKLQTFLYPDGQLSYNLSSEHCCFSLSNMQTGWKYNTAFPTHVLDIQEDFDYKMEGDLENILTHVVNSGVYKTIPGTFRQYQKLDLQVSLT